MLYTTQCLKISEKGIIQRCERSELCLQFLSGQKFITNAKNGQFDDCLRKLKVAVKQCYQTGRKLVENAKIKKTSNATILVIFKQCGTK